MQNLRTFLAALALCLVAAQVDAWAASPLSAGVAKTKVTPPVEIPQLTSSGSGTNAPFKGVHDDLFARALVLDDGKQPIAMLAVDSIGYDNDILGPGRDFTRELRERVAGKTGLKPAAVMLAASHTHSAPETLDLSPFRETAGASEWLERHLEQLAETVIEAWQCRTPVRLRAGSIATTGLQRYRRIQLKVGGESRRGPLPKPEDVATPWELDESLYVIYLETAEGKPRLQGTGQPYEKRPADRDLWSETAYKDFRFIVDWRLPKKPEAKKLPVFTADGLYARGKDGKYLDQEIFDAGDSGVFVRGNTKSQVNIWSQPIGSGDINDYHKDEQLSAELRKACLPKKKADAKSGEWNRFVITMRGERITVVLNGETVIDAAELPEVPPRGPIGLQDHNDPIEFRNLFLKRLD